MNRGLREEVSHGVVSEGEVLPRGGLVVRDKKLLETTAPLVQRMLGIQQTQRLVFVGIVEARRQIEVMGRSQQK